ncbi:adenosine deaminase 2 [Tachyglossus aculeatus]|uniref:adenosine deaminase 2 n=1 Tax=Tachyglossus aculeatus TaxID=9261 RepID=UPI0018F50CF9|nr:adenosine deaminase 2 [Tachyglossus aculeatus]
MSPLRRGRRSALLLLLLTTAVAAAPHPAAPREASLDIWMREEEDRMRVGGQLPLTPREAKANERLVAIKEAEWACSTKTARFPPSMHFFQAKRFIDDSRVFRVLKDMPKGGALHVHNPALLTVRWLIEATYRPHCYACFTPEGDIRFRFAHPGPPAPLTKACSDWVLLDKFRERLLNVTEFDNSILRNMTLETEEPEKAYPDQATVWKRFEGNFGTLSGLVRYAPVFQDYLAGALKEFYEDNVQYMELRTMLTPIYELDGQFHDEEWLLQTYHNVTREFIKDHPDFIGFKIIVTDHRANSIQNLNASLQRSMKLKAKFPDIIAGFDLVGHEDKGQALWELKDMLTSGDFPLPYFFHAGETNWHGTDVDENILDALHLNTSRIGHGFAMARHPVAQKMALSRDVPIEVCPISNQVLKLVSDMRNHPAASLMAIGQPMVISSDDPALFGARGLSYDFYEAFMGIGGRRADLRTLKQLALNSLK